MHFGAFDTHPVDNEHLFFGKTFSYLAAHKNRVTRRRKAPALWQDSSKAQREVTACLVLF
jgi:hypothetical protein